MLTVTNSNHLLLLLLAFSWLLICNCAFSLHKSQQNDSSVTSILSNGNHQGKRILSTEFDYTGAPQYYSVPIDVRQLKITVWGASGGEGNLGGEGASIQAIFAVSPGQQLVIYVGGQGALFSGGYNGGGAAAIYGPYATGGGGATDVRVSPYTLEERILVAGGGGGSAYCGAQGGAGGYPGGEDGEMCGSFNPGGGANGRGGSKGDNYGYCGYFSNGFLGTGGQGCVYPGTKSFGGAGGGGYYGGGGAYASGGGGGSSSSVNPPTYYTTGGRASANGYAVIEVFASGTAIPTTTPVPNPSLASSTGPTLIPTRSPTTVLSAIPSAGPSIKPSAQPITPSTPAAAPTVDPIVSPTPTPSLFLNVNSTATPSVDPTAAGSLRGENSYSGGGEGGDDAGTTAAIVLSCVILGIILYWANRRYGKLHDSLSCALHRR